MCFMKLSVYPVIFQPLSVLKVFLLKTKYNMQNSFLRDYFVYDGIKVVVPFKSTEG